MSFTLGISLILLNDDELINAYTYISISQEPLSYCEIFSISVTAS